MISKLWRCEVCGKPIKAETGYVTISDPKGGYPQFEPKESSDPFEAFEPAQVVFRVLHRACDPNPNSGEYWIDVDRAKTLVEWLHWANHLSGKVWMGKYDVCSFIGLWFKNRGLYWERVVS